MVSEEFDNWLNSRNETIKNLKELRDDICKHHKNTTIAKISGTCANVVSTGLIIGGIFFTGPTFGFSSLLTIAGIGLATAGSGTCIGSEITNMVITKILLKKARELVEKDMELTKKLVTKLETDLKFAKNSIKVLKTFLSNGDKIKKESVKFLGKAAIAGSEKEVKLSTKIFQTSLLLLGTAMDVLDLVENSIKIHKKVMPKEALELTKIIEELQKHTD